MVTKIKMLDIKNTLLGFVPKEWLEYFDVTEIKELEKEWQITLIEKEGLTPKSLTGKIATLNGYMNPIELEDFPLRGKQTYLKFFRRRWKEKGKNTSHFNEYNFHPEGMKATKEFGVFLKGLDREASDFFFSYWSRSRE